MLLKSNVSLVSNWLQDPGISVYHDLKSQLSQSSYRTKRARREDYDHDEYEVVCKHSNTGMKMTK